MGKSWENGRFIDDLISLMSLIGISDFKKETRGIQATIDHESFQMGQYGSPIRNKNGKTMDGLTPVVYEGPMILRPK